MEVTTNLGSKKVVFSLVLLLAVSISVNFLIYNHFNAKYEVKFSHISPSIAWMEVGDFLEVQNSYSVNFQDMKKDILSIVNSSENAGNYGIYFEDLQTGAWIGINEKEPFISASLLKVPVLVAILKKVEMGEIDISQSVFLSERDLDSNSGTLFTKGLGYRITVKELLIYLIKESDNTALRALQYNFLTSEDIIEARLAMGLPVEGQSIAYLGPKDYSNMLRSLYYSAYLRRTFSEMALSIMSETDYNTQIPSGVPKGIPVSHKVGFVTTEGVPHYHDCGIIYHPIKPYILCVMTEGADQEEADRVISSISKEIYSNIDSLTRD